MPKDYKRPDIPYEGDSLPNNTRYELLTQSKRPPTSEMLDGEMNYLIDSLNDLDQKIEGVEAGAIPGSSEALNANKVLKTDGEGNLSWIQVTDEQIQDQAVTTPKVAEGSITTEKLGNASVTTVKIYDQNVTKEKIQDGAVTTNKLKNKAVTVDKILAGAVTSSRIKDKAITTEKLNTKAVTTETLNDQAVTTPKLANSSVTQDKVAPNAVSNTKIKDLAVTNAKINTVHLDKIAWSANKLLITGDDSRGASIAFPKDSSSKVLISKTSSPYGHFRTLTQLDLPQAGVQPVYMRRWNPDGSVIKDYNPFRIKTSWSRISSGRYRLSLNQSAANFILVATIDASINSSGVVYTSYSGTNIDVHTTKAQSGHEDYGGQLVLYKMP
jgi:hypothetical protein